MRAHLGVQNKFSLLDIVRKHENGVHKSTYKQTTTLLPGAGHFFLHDVEFVLVFLCSALEHADVLLVACKQQDLLRTVLNKLLKRRLLEMMMLIRSKVEDTNPAVLFVMADVNGLQVVVFSVFH
jgi:hypothetical protein